MEKSFFTDEADFKYFLLKNNLKTKILKKYYKSFIIVVPNFKEYKCLFGDGKTPTCYAHSKCHWDNYHTKNSSLQLNFLSFKKLIPKKFKYLTFCFRHLKYDGKNKIINGYVEVHDYEHNSYSFKLVYDRYAKLFIGIYDRLSANLVKELDECFAKCSIINDVASKACELILKNEMIIK